MSVSTIAMTSSTTGATTSEFWERLWRSSGIHFVVFAIIAYAVHGHQPAVGASDYALTAFYQGDRTRILIAAFLSGMTVLNLLWFVAALRATLADAGCDGWGGAATAASAALGALLFLGITLGTVLAYSTTGAGNLQLTSGLNDVLWALVVLTSFPRAMLIMAGTFGLWRAGLISNAFFAGGVAVVIAVLLGGTTWMSGGFWAPDGAYSRFVSPAIGLLWVLAVSRVLLTRPPAKRPGW
jgi:hypothetical protein